MDDFIYREDNLFAHSTSFQIVGIPYSQLKRNITCIRPTKKTGYGTVYRGMYAKSSG